MKTLIILAHQYFESSRVNKAMKEEVQNLKEVEFRHLDEIYGSNLKAINVKKEQEFLVNAKNIVFEFPLFWYNTPPMLKAYQDEVFTHGFAYGSKGVALKDKKIYLAVTTGSALEKYGEDREKALENLKTLLKPFYFAMETCHTKIGDIFVADGIFTKSDDEIKEDAKRYRDFILNLD